MHLEGLILVYCFSSLEKFYIFPIFFHKYRVLVCVKTFDSSMIIGSRLHWCFWQMLVFEVTYQVISDFFSENTRTQMSGTKSTWDSSLWIERRVTRAGFVSAFPSVKGMMWVKTKWSSAGSVYGIMYSK